MMNTGAKTPRMTGELWPRIATAELKEPRPAMAWKICQGIRNLRGASVGWRHRQRERDDNEGELYLCRIREDPRVYPPGIVVNVNRGGN